MDSTRRLFALQALLRAAQEGRFRGCDEPMIKVALDYGRSQKITRLELIEVLAMPVVEALGVGDRGGFPVEED